MLGSRPPQSLAVSSIHVRQEAAYIADGALGIVCDAESLNDILEPGQELLSLACIKPLFLLFRRVGLVLIDLLPHRRLRLVVR
jgi:hypothetical protein